MKKMILPNCAALTNLLIHCHPDTGFRIRALRSSTLPLSHVGPHNVESFTIQGWPSCRNSHFFEFNALFCEFNAFIVHRAIMLFIYLATGYLCYVIFFRTPLRVSGKKLFWKASVGFEHTIYDFPNRQLQPLHQGPCPAVKLTPSVRWTLFSDTFNKIT